LRAEGVVQKIGKWDWAEEDERQSLDCYLRKGTKKIATLEVK